MAISCRDREFCQIINDVFNTKSIRFEEMSEAEVDFFATVFEKIREAAQGNLMVQFCMQMEGLEMNIDIRYVGILESVKRATSILVYIMAMTPTVCSVKVGGVLVIWKSFLSPLLDWLHKLAWTKKKYTMLVVMENTFYIREKLQDLSDMN